MLYKSLFLLVFANMFNQAYQMQQINCPKWVPGTNQVVPAGVTLSPSLELQNRVRCYCEVVKRMERECIERNIPKTICLSRTSQWVEENLSLYNGFQFNNRINPLPVRDRMMTIEP